MDNNSFEANEYTQTNIELKARVEDFDLTENLLKEISGEQFETLLQRDIFFLNEKGRLKLRIFGAESGELIFYDRSDVMTKQSFYVISKTTEPRHMETILSHVLGVRGVVQKRRYVYQYGQMRIHLDSVEELGNFLEIEFVMKPGQEAHEGIRAVKDMKKLLAIQESNLISGSYIDMLENRMSRTASSS